MGYFFAAAIFAVLMVLFIVALMGRGGGDKKMGRGTLPSPRPVVREEPSADEPTPAESVTARPQQREAARRKTPPA
jgi:hypothetical protein